MHATLPSPADLRVPQQDGVHLHRPALAAGRLSWPTRLRTGPSRSACTCRGPSTRSSTLRSACFSRRWGIGSWRRSAACIRSSGRPVYGLRSHEGFWRFAVLRNSASTGRWMVNLVTAFEERATPAGSGGAADARLFPRSLRS
ncbi:MAG: hypothetical protein MZV70_76095 [Desulfobacterales bacterium]|nr:hypothetical protein [Desulfobacterales bacterium]